jgi:hypothetical protein
VDIQHRARWSSTKQLKTYDLSHQDDTFKLELIKRGLIEPDDGNKELAPRTKQCLFCQEINGIAESICGKCTRPLDRKLIEEQEKSLKQDQDSLRGELDLVRQQMQMLMSKFNSLLLESGEADFPRIRDIWIKEFPLENTLKRRKLQSV